jgi:hypothetical protein
MKTLTESALAVELQSPRELASHARNPRRHSKKQIKQIAASIERFGFTSPVLIGDDGEILAGHARVEAAKLLGLKSVPTIKLSHLTDAERRAYVIADNKLALNASWDHELLAIELKGLIDLNFDVTLTGFSLAETDIVLGDAAEPDPLGAGVGVRVGIGLSVGGREADAIAQPADAATSAPVSRMGDLWILGRHRLICGDATNTGDVARVMEAKPAHLIVTAPADNRAAAMGHGGAVDQAADPAADPAAFLGALVETLGHAERCGRSARVIEADPRCCDTIIRRYQQLTGKDALLAISGATFEATATDRAPKSRLKS